MKYRLAHLIATVFGIGHLRPAPGTWGSLAAFPMLWLIWSIGGLWLTLLALPIGVAKGLWAIPIYTAKTQDHDPSEVVIDEVLGQWVALLPVMFGAAYTGVSPLPLWPGLVTAFVLFRLFDIWKPGPIGWADRRQDTMGVLLDDILAGCCAAICLSALAVIAHTWFFV